MKITALAGGVGGAKLANGLIGLLSPEDFCVIVNTGDDFIYSGLYICPDIDTMIYTLAGINNPVDGWGLKNETWNVLYELERLGHPTWFNLGDRDIATHLERTRLHSSGYTLTDVTKKLSSYQGVKHNILPMTDSPVQTIISTEELGEISFQEYFVKYRFQPTTKKIYFKGVEAAVLPEEARSRLISSDLVIICPSNPFVSIDPILSVSGVREILSKKTIIAVSPLIGGKTIKGPAAKLMNELGTVPSSLNIAKYYGNLLTGFILDHTDHEEADAISQCGIIPLVTDILMPDSETQIKLASKVLKFGQELLKDK